MISPDVARYLDAFQKQDRGRDAPAWLNELRRSAIASFSELGFPTVKQEAWKYTNVQPIIAQPFVWDDGESRRISEAELRAQLFFQDTAPRLVFVNGSYVAEFSTVEGLPEGVRLGNLSHWVASDGAGLDSYLGRSADFRRSGFVALNTAFARDGAVVQIPSGCRVRQPIQLVYLSRGAERPVISHPRTLIILGAESETSMVESYAALDGGAYLCNPVTEIFAADGARARHYRIQKEGSAGSHVGTVAARLGRNCGLTAVSVTLSGSLVRNDVQVELDGEGAESALSGLYLGADHQHVDTFTEIAHLRPRATSTELYKGILDGASRAVFNGKIIVHKDAQKSDARQSNKNLLLSPNAVVNTNPQLEIYADDVKCTHGSTIGQLDPNALFYLRARGLGPEEARSLLRFAFASEIIEAIKIASLRASLDQYLAAQFHKA